MSIPLSALGISNEEKDLLSTRLFPEANSIFLERLANEMGFQISEIQQIDYANHPVWKMKKMMRDREAKAKFLQKRIDNGDFDIKPFEVKYKTLEEAIEKEDNPQILMEGGQSIEDLNKEIERIKLLHYAKKNSMDVINEELQFPIDYDGDDEKEDIWGQ